VPCAMIGGEFRGVALSTALTGRNRMGLGVADSTIESLSSLEPSSANPYPSFVKASTSVCSADGGDIGSGSSNRATATMRVHQRGVTLTEGARCRIALRN
jgi:hypothetical protein